MYSSQYSSHDCNIFQTAISLAKCLYLLAKHPEVQEKLYKEICEKSPLGSEVTSDTLNSLSYLRAVVKETHR